MAWKIKITIQWFTSIIFVQYGAAFCHQRKRKHLFSHLGSFHHSSISCSRFEDDIINSLDLVPIIRGVADHTGTRRGHQALLHLVGEDDGRKFHAPTSIPARWRRVMQEFKSEPQRRLKRYEELVSIAKTRDEALREYELVEQAMIALGKNRQCDTVSEITFPPFYTSGSTPDNVCIRPESDDDEWLWMPPSELTLEHVIQAEQVLIILLQVYNWAVQTETSNWMPDLSAIGRRIPHNVLFPVFKEIANSAEILRVRSAVNIDGRSAYVFRLKQDKYPQLDKLRTLEKHLVDTIDREMRVILRKTKGTPEYLDYDNRKVLLIPKSDVVPKSGRVRGYEGGRCYVEPFSVVEYGDKLQEVRKELQSAEAEIEKDLIKAILKSQQSIDNGLQVIARLDVVFARAAFGKKLKGTIPRVASNGCISIHQFIHPILSLGNLENVVPMDLYLGDEISGNIRSLIISGPNGGGKSVALKSFGIAAMMVKASIPIPHSSEVTPHVDFFPRVLVDLGDQQNLEDGESTFMAKINSYSSILEKIKTEETLSTLILLDELGGGTDPFAGGAIAQAILESFLGNKDCRVVSTTHSPRLKALSYHDDRFDCASVLMKRGEGRYALPSYQLKYGLIGDSYALEAASRADPTLPAELITRTAEILTDSDQGSMNGELIQALTQSLEQRIDEADECQKKAENLKDSLGVGLDSLLMLARAYEKKFEVMDKHLDSILEQLKSDKSRELEVLGNTLATLRLAKKKVKSVVEDLRERGLKPVSAFHNLVEGDIVVVISKGPWEGASGRVVSCGGDHDSIAVLLDTVPWNDQTLSVGQSNDILWQKHPINTSLVFKRYELAVWDYDSVWNNARNEPPTNANLGIRESKQNLVAVLNSIGVPRSGKVEPTLGSKSSSISLNSTTSSRFISSRQRKAAASSKKKKKK
jgi:MutS domain V